MVPAIADLKTLRVELNDLKEQIQKGEIEGGAPGKLDEAQLNGLKEELETSITKVALDLKGLSDKIETDADEK